MLRVEPEAGEAPDQASGGRFSVGSGLDARAAAAEGAAVFLKIGDDTLSLDEVNVSNLKLARTMLRMKQSEVRLASGDAVGPEGAEGCDLDVVPSETQ